MSSQARLCSIIVPTMSGNLHVYAILICWIAYMGGTSVPGRHQLPWLSHREHAHQELLPDAFLVLLSTSRPW